MNPGLPYPTPDEVEAAGLAELRYWLNELPGGTGEKWAVMQRNIRRLVDMWERPYEQHQGRAFASPVQDPAVESKTKAPKPAKPAPKPQDKPAEEPAPSGYFKSLFP